jgi:glycosyltransferase involved in cell wall biosynthesis
MDRRRRLTIVCGSFNEEDNVAPMWERVTAALAALPGYDWDWIWIDNCSTDRTVERLKAIAARDRRLKLIVNARNFGHVRSPFHGLIQGTGDAVVSLASDLQDPPELIPELVKKWEEGNKVVLAQKTQSDESPVFFAVRRLYYRLIRKLADVDLVENVTGFGLYDREVVAALRQISDPYPYLRGLVCELGHKRALVSFRQPLRKRGLTKNNLFTLYDTAMLGLTSHSRAPLRLATMFGFLGSFLCLVTGLGYLAYKLVHWNEFSLGAAPAVVGLFLFASVQLFFTGILGEYIGAIHAQVRSLPRVVEAERVNFDEPERPGA